MEIILLERVEKLGAIGDVVTVKDGFARNFLLPNKKALRANDANSKVFEANRERIETDNADAAPRPRSRRRTSTASRADPRVVEHRPALRFGHGPRHRRGARSRQAPRSTSARSSSIARSRRSACTTSRSRCTPRSRDVKVNVARSDDEAELQARASTSSPTMFEDELGAGRRGPSDPNAEPATDGAARRNADAKRYRSEVAGSRLPKPKTRRPKPKLNPPPKRAPPKTSSKLRLQSTGKVKGRRRIRRALFLRLGRTTR